MSKRTLKSMWTGASSAVLEEIREQLTTFAGAILVVGIVAFLLVPLDWFMNGKAVGKGELGNTGLGLLSLVSLILLWALSCEFIARLRRD